MKIYIESGEGSLNFNFKMKLDLIKFNLISQSLDVLLKMWPLSLLDL